MNNSGSFCSASFALLFNDFITIWIGEQYILPRKIIYICILNFYLKGVLYPIWCYRNTTGLFKDTKYLMIIASVINLVLSIIFGINYGLIGIFMATAISRLTTNVWYEPMILFTRYFKQSVSRYYFAECFRFFQIIIIIGLSNILFDVYCIDNIGIRLLVKVIYCVVVPNTIVILEYCRSEEFHTIAKKIKELFF